MIYFTGCHRPETLNTPLGLLATPMSGYSRHIPAYAGWAADNGCFGKGFTLERWQAWLEAMAPQAGGCAFATAPDIVGDPDRTQARADHLLQYVRSVGFKAALVAQDGLELTDFDCHCAAGKAGRKRWARQHTQQGHWVDGWIRCDACGDQRVGGEVHEGRVRTWVPPGDWVRPDGTWTCSGCQVKRGTYRDPNRCDCDWWGEFDALFLGGSTEWKLSLGAAELAREARSRGKWVHMGRVNSRQRLLYAALVGCDSADGTYVAFGPDRNLPRLLGWLKEAEQVEPMDDGEWSDYSSLRSAGSSHDAALAELRASQLPLAV